MPKKYKTKTKKNYKTKKTKGKTKTNKINTSYRGKPNSISLTRDLVPLHTDMGAGEASGNFFPRIWMYGRTQPDGSISPNSLAVIDFSGFCITKLPASTEFLGLFQSYKLNSILHTVQFARNTAVDPESLSLAQPTSQLRITILNRKFATDSNVLAGPTADDIRYRIAQLVKKKTFLSYSGTVKLYTKRPRMFQEQHINSSPTAPVVTTLSSNKWMPNTTAGHLVTYQSNDIMIIERVDGLPMTSAQGMVFTTKAYLQFSGIR